MLDEFIDIDVMTVDDETENNDPEKPDPYCVLIQYSQLKLLLHQCHFYIHATHDDNLKCYNKGGVVFANF